MRPVCGRCGDEIVGVVPIWSDGVPVCRNCSYSNSTKKPTRKETGTYRNASISEPERVSSRIRPGVVLFVLLAAIVISVLKAGQIVSAIEPERPIYRGAAGLDPVTERCISNLWTITGLLQEEAVSWPAIRCPATGKPYTLIHLRGNSIVSCPNPEEHEVNSIRVTRNSPVPEVDL